MQLFPLYTNLQNKRVVVIGGGDVAERKVQLMLQAGACVYVIAPAVNQGLQLLAHKQKITLLAQTFSPTHLDDAWFVIAATNQVAVNAQVAQEAAKRKLFVNVVDDPGLSSVHVPAIINRSPLIVSVSSSGTAPMIARHVREQIESLVDDSMGQLTSLAHAYRDPIRERHPDMPARRKFYEWLIHGPVLQHVRNNQNTLAEDCLKNALQHASDSRPGHTFHISIPGDNPGDVTLHTLRALNQADAIFHDERISTKVLDLARRDADRHSYTPAATPTPDSNVPDIVLEKLAHLSQRGSISVLLTRPDPQEKLHVI